MQIWGGGGGQQGHQSCHPSFHAISTVIKLCQYIQSLSRSGSNCNQCQRLVPRQISLQIFAFPIGSLERHQWWSINFSSSGFKVAMAALQWGPSKTLPSVLHVLMHIRIISGILPLACFSNWIGAITVFANHEGCHNIGEILSSQLTREKLRQKC